MTLTVYRKKRLPVKWQEPFFSGFFPVLISFRQAEPDPFARESGLFYLVSVPLNSIVLL